MITMRRIGSPVRVGVMRSNNSDAAAGFRNTMQLRNETHHIGNVFDYMTTNNLVKLTFSERIRNDAQIVNHICLSAGIGIDAGCAWILVLAAADVENFFRWVCRLQLVR